jgi:hypothetical protein
MVTAAQIAERFELGRAVSYARLGGMTQLGLVEHQRIFHAEPGVYLATRQGLHSVDLEVPAARVDLRTYRHDVELSSLVIELEREFGPERVVTEREIRALDTPGLRQEPDYRPLFGVLLGGAGPGPPTPAGNPRVLPRRGGGKRRIGWPPCDRAGADGKGPHAAPLHPARLRRRSPH